MTRLFTGIVCFLMIVLTAYPGAVVNKKKPQPAKQNAASKILKPRGGKVLKDSLAQVIAADSNALEAYKSLGDIYLKEKNTGEALRLYRLYVDKGGHDIIAVQTVMVSFYNAKEYDKVVLYSLKMPQASMNLECQQILADALYQTKEYGKALPLIKALLLKKQAPPVKGALLKKAALSHFALNDTAASLYFFNQYNKINKSKDADAAYFSALFQEKTKQTLAVTLYQRNVRLYPKDYRNYLRLGVIFSENPKTKAKALAFLKTATKLTDTSATAWLLIGDAFSRQRNNVGALGAYKKYKQLAPEDIAADVRIGALQVENNDIDAALNTLEAVKTRAANSPEFIKALSDAYLKKGMVTEAIALLEPAQDMQGPVQNAVLKNLCIAYTQAGINDKAAVILNKVLEKDRTPDLLLLQAQILYRTGKLKEAEDAVSEICAVTDPTVPVLMLMASIQTAVKKYDDAVKTYTDIMAMEPRYVDAVYGRAEVYMKMQKALWAEKFYKRALTINPNHTPSYLGLATIAALRKDQALYDEYMAKARELDPNNPKLKEQILAKENE